MAGAQRTVLLVVSLAVAVPASAAPHPYQLPPVQTAKFTRIDAPGAGSASGQGTQVLGINSSGATTGWYADAYNIWHGFVRSPSGKFTTFQVDGLAATANGINDKGEIAGTYVDAKTLTWRGFLRSAAGKFKKFECDSNNACYTIDLMTINNSSTISGDYAVQGSVNVHAFYRLKNGTLSEFDAPGAADTRATGINNESIITGPYIDSNSITHAYIRAADGTFTEFDAPGSGGMVDAFPACINMDGWVGGGYSDSSNVFHAFLRDPAGNFTEFDVPGASGTGVDSINRHLTAAGGYSDANNVPHGFMRRKDGTIVEFDPPGSTFTVVSDINDSDDIVGFYIDSDGAYHGFLRTP